LKRTFRGEGIRRVRGRDGGQDNCSSIVGGKQESARKNKNDSKKREPSGPVRNVMWGRKKGGVGGGGGEKVKGFVDGD